MADPAPGKERKAGSVKIRLNLFRALMRVIAPETSRYAIGGWHVEGRKLEVTDARMLAVVPLEPEFPNEPGAPPNTFAKPFAVPSSAGTKREGFLGMIRLRLGKRRGFVQNKRGDSIEVRPIEGTWPKTGDVVPTDAPTYSTHLSPILFEKALAIFKAAVPGDAIENMAITIEFRKDAQYGNERVIVMRQPATGVVVYLMPVRVSEPCKKDGE